jgi:hypothetical protein
MQQIIATAVLIDYRNNNNNNNNNIPNCCIKNKNKTSKSKAIMQMSTFTFDETFEAVVAISAILIISSAAWIICILINIEKTKVVALSTVLEDDGTGSGGTGNDLHFEESVTTVSSSSSSSGDNKQLEVEPADGNTTNNDGVIRSSPTRGSGRGERGIVTPSTSPPSTAKRRRRKNRRVSGMFVGIQCLSVCVLILLTYLLLVVSSAPIALRILGSLCVFGIFLRFQIGEELRRQRVDRIMLLLSLFLVIASMLSSLVYSMKSLSQGEIYEGPARIVGYDMEQYNNSQHDPTTRTDIAVTWGKNWGCPLSGGKVCQARIQGAMCQTHPEKEQTKHKPNYDEDSDGRRFLKETKEEDQAEEVEEELEEDLEDEEDSNQDLEEDNESLEEENEELKEEIEELKEENEIEEEEEDELVDEENTELDEIVDEYDEDIMIVEEEEYDQAEEYEDAIYEMDEENLEEEIESTDDDATIEELDEEIDEDVEEIDELDEEYEEVRYMVYLPYDCLVCAWHKYMVYSFMFCLPDTYPFLYFTVFVVVCFSYYRMKNILTNTLTNSKKIPKMSMRSSQRKKK